MTVTEKFAERFYKIKQSMVKSYLDKNEKSQNSKLIQSLNLNDKQVETLRRIIDGVLTDAFFTILIGIDGVDVIDNEQEFYTLLTQGGEEITGGDLEGEAYEYFHNFKYQIEHGTSDFIAILKYKLEGGRTRPVWSGYRPHIKFDFERMQTSGQQRFIDRKVVYPGDTVYAQIDLWSVDHFANRLENGMKFEFKEGDRVIGDGKIIAIVNPQLRKIKTP